MKDLSGYKIKIIGDSISKGLYLDNSVIRKFEKNAVDEISEHFKIEIENFSMFGQTLKRMKEKNIYKTVAENSDTSKKNVVVLCLGGNDADYKWEEVSRSPEEKHQPKTPLADFAIMLDEIVTYLKNRGMNVILTSIFPIDSNRYFKNVISKMSNGDNVLKFFGGDVSNIARHQECYNIEVINCARKHNCNFIDYRSKIIQMNNFLDYLCQDGAHPNEKGHRFVADLIIDEIENNLHFDSAKQERIS